MIPLGNLNVQGKVIFNTINKMSELHVLRNDVKILQIKVIEIWIL